MKNRAQGALVASVVFLAVSGATATPMTLTVTPGKPNLVKFTSVAPLETIVGHTDKISGSLHFDPADLSSPATGEFEVDMTSLDTDNRIRNGHMRANHLQTDKFPTAKFVLTALGATPPERIQDGIPAEFTVIGDFTCHGVTRRIEPRVTAIWNAETHSLEVTAKFSVLLADYAIPRPQFLVMKLDEKQEVAVHFIGKAL